MLLAAVEGAKSSLLGVPSLQFLERRDRILATGRFSTDEDTKTELSVQDIVQIYEWLVCHLLQRWQLALERHREHADGLTAKNNTQVFLARELSLAFIEVSEVIVLNLFY